MANQVTNSHIHWNYYIALEQDLAKLARFIEFSEDNFNSYSIELAHLLLASSSEVDVVLKALCNLKNPNKSHKNISDYRSTIQELLSEFSNEVCYVSRYGLKLNPWLSWNDNVNPDWWRSYNNVKHQRNVHFKEANLKNVLNSLAGLSLAVLYYYRALFSQDSVCTFKDVVRTLRPSSTDLIQFKQEYINVAFTV